MPWIQTGIIVLYNMDANKELNDAVDRRIAREMAFKEEIIAQINAIIAALELCDPTNAASTLDLSQEQLRQVIEKLDTMDVINASESARISNVLTTKNLRRGPDAAAAAPVAPAAAAAAPVAVPAPKSYAAAVGTPAGTPAATGPTWLEKTKNVAGRVGNAVVQTGVNLATATSPPPAGYVPPAKKSGGRRTRRRKTRR